MTMKRTPDQRLSDRQKIAEMLCQGLSVRDIFKSGKLSVPLSDRAIRKDAELVREGWVRDTKDNFEKLLGQQLAEVRFLKKTAWDAWMASCQERQTRIKERTRKSGEVIDRGRLVSTGQTGNPAYLEKICWCLAQEARILGLYAPEQIKILLEKEAEEIARDFGMSVREVMDEAERILLYERRE
jgi:hypothetical protein